MRLKSTWDQERAPSRWQCEGSRSRDEQPPSQSGGCVSQRCPTRRRCRLLCQCWKQDNVWEVEKKNSHLVSRVERQAAASSKRHRAAEQESQEDSFSCRSLDGSTNSIWVWDIYGNLTLMGDPISSNSTWSSFCQGFPKTKQILWAPTPLGLSRWSLPELFEVPRWEVPPPLLCWGCFHPLCCDERQCHPAQFHNTQRQRP